MGFGYRHGGFMDGFGGNGPGALGIVMFVVFWAAVALLVASARPALSPRPDATCTTRSRPRSGTRNDYPHRQRQSSDRHLDGAFRQGRGIRRGVHPSSHPAQRQLIRRVARCRGCPLRHPATNDQRCEGREHGPARLQRLTRVRCSRDSSASRARLEASTRWSRTTATASTYSNRSPR